jgi:ABC-type glycerol-3-phosphate transport system substrate-binding protein
MASTPSIPHRVTRRAALAWPAAGSAALWLAACNAGGAGEPAATRKPAAPVEIEHWNTLAPDHPESVARMAVLDSFAKNNPDLVRMTHGQSGTSQSVDKFKAAIAGGVPPNIAVFYQYLGSDLFTLGGLLDLNDALKGDRDWGRAKGELYPKVLAANVWKSHQFGVPIYNSYFNMYFHRERLRQAGLAEPKRGWTWDDFLVAIRKAARPPDVWGYNSQWVTAHHMMWVGANGGSFLNKDGTKAALTAQENVDAAQFERDLVGQRLMRDAATGYAELLEQGGVVFQFAVPARIPVYRKANVDFGTTLWPIGPRNRAKEPYTLGAAYAYTAFRNPDPDKQAVVAKAAVYGASREGQLTIARLAGVPISNRATVESADYKQLYQKDDVYWPFVEVLPSFQPYPNYPKFQESYNTLTAQLARIWKMETTPKEALTEAERQIQLQLDESLRLG